MTLVDSACGSVSNEQTVNKKPAEGATRGASAVEASLCDSFRTERTFPFVGNPGIG